MAETDSSHYLKALAQIPKIALAAFGVTLLAQLFAVVAEKIHNHETAFNPVAKLLLHYSESFPAIFAFFGVNMILLCLTVLWEGSDLGDLIRKWFVLPSLHICEHMISLSIGAYSALGIIESFTIGIPFGSIWKTMAAVIFVDIVLFSIAFLCAITAEFIERDYTLALSRLGRLRLPVIFTTAGSFLFVLYSDLVWHYAAISVHAK